MMILIGGSAANPPTIGHRRVLEEVAQYGSRNGGRKVIWLPSGTRSDKDMLPAVLRRKMIEAAFPPQWIAQQPIPVEIDWSDIDGDNTPTIDVFHDLFNRYPGNEVVWYTGADSVVPMRDYGGLCEIRAKWKCGEELFTDPRYRFLILPRAGWEHPGRLNLPEHFSWIDAALPEVSSSEVRTSVRCGEILLPRWLAPGVEEMLYDYYFNGEHAGEM